MPIALAICLALSISAPTPGNGVASGVSYSPIPIINAARLFFSDANTEKHIINEQIKIKIRCIIIFLDLWVEIQFSE